MISYKKMVAVVAFIGIMIPLVAMPITFSNPGREEQKLVGQPRVQHSINNVVELLVVVDYEFIQIYGNNTSDIFRYVSDVIHDVSEIYENDFGIRIVLVNMTFFYGGNPFIPTEVGNGEIDVASYLSLFNQYRGSGETPPHDYAILLSGKDFQDNVREYGDVGVIGYPGFSSMIAQTQNSTVKDAILLAHGMGHGFGMYHDSTGNACNANALIMSPAIGNSPALLSPLPTTFSTCSHAYLDAFDSLTGLTCLKNAPVSTYCIDAPGNIIINTLGSGNLLAWNLTDIILVDVYLNGELFNTTFFGHLADSGTSTVSSGNNILTLDVDRMQLVAGMNNITAWFYFFDVAGSAVPIKSAINVSLNASLVPEFVYPIGGETLKDVVTVSWNEGASPGSGITYDLYVRRFNGTWILIKDGISGTSYGWNTTGLAKGDGYVLKLVAIPNDGGTWVSTSSSPFRLAAPDPELKDIVTICIVLGVGGIVGIMAASHALKKRKQSRTEKGPV